MSIENENGEINFHNCKINTENDLIIEKCNYILFDECKLNIKKIIIKKLYEYSEIHFYGNNNIKYLDLSEMDGGSISILNHKITKINLKNSNTNINFNDIEFIVNNFNLYGYKGNLNFDGNDTQIKIKYLDIRNSKGIINFKNAGGMPKEMRKTFKLDKGLKNNFELVKFFDRKSLDFFKNELIELYNQGLINLTKLKHQTEFKVIYNWFKNEVIKNDNDFNLFESLISFKQFKSF